MTKWSSIKMMKISNSNDSNYEIYGQDMLFVRMEWAHPPKGEMQVLINVKCSLH